MFEERIRLNKIRRERERKRHILIFIISASITIFLTIAGGSFISKAQGPIRLSITNIIPASGLKQVIPCGRLQMPMPMRISNPRNPLLKKWSEPIIYWMIISMRVTILLFRIIQQSSNNKRNNTY
ncbi:hypothetical protein [Eisenbergiella tayi]